MKRKLATLAVGAAFLAASCMTAFGAEETATEAATEKTELQAAFDEEMDLGRYITSRGAAYDFDTWSEYEHYWFQIGWSWDKTGEPIENAADGIFNKLGDKVAENGEEVVATLKELRENVIQTVADPEDVCWYIWDDGTPENMPQEEGVEDLDFEHTFDNEGFVPFIVPYMLRDQSKVKGNVVVVAGGGFQQRCHDYEADASALRLNDLGYNAFILNRRVAPFAEIDCSIDLQRAVRYIRYYADEKGIGAIDNIATVGFSGGGMTVCNQLMKCYGDITPDAIYDTYVPDEIDEINSDYKVAGIYYGAPKEGGIVTENENMPALFVTVGMEDELLYSQTMDLINQANENDWICGAYLCAEAPHGYALTGVRGVTDEGTTLAAYATDAFDEFMDVYFGYEPVHF